MLLTRNLFTLLIVGGLTIACADSAQNPILETKWISQQQGALEPGEPGTDCAEDGAFTSCYFGPAGTKGVGACTAGTQWCISGKRTACKQQVLPKDELCDGADNDCDGNVDEGFGQTSCGTGACAVTVDNCANGKFSDCEFESLKMASPEVCDGADNDCDSATDENQDGDTLTADCYTGAEGTEDVGLCHGGTQTCTEGAWSACVGEVTPTDDVCDAKDNDCDGSADEDFDDLGATCVVGVGTCESTGTYVCNADADGVECDALPGEPEDEVCDGLDNDCDEETDENADGEPLTQSCYTGSAGTEGVGVCTAGEQTCTEGAWGSCDGQVVDSPETCDAKDNDCDGSVDEGADGSELTQSCYTGTEGTAGVGACSAGVNLCLAGSFVTKFCFGETKDTAEVCFNGVDDDCDGTADENCTPPCTDNDNDGYGSGCDLGADCDDTNASANAAQPEWCGNGKDDDCDGTADELGCHSTAGGATLVRFTQTGICALTHLVFYTDFASVASPTTKTFKGDPALTQNEWEYKVAGGTDGLHRLNLEFSNNDFTGDELMYVETGPLGPVVHDECGELRVFYEGVETDWSALTDPRDNPSPFQESNVFVCFGDAAGCFLCGGDWDGNGTADCDEATDGQCDLNPKDTAACQ